MAKTFVCGVVTFFPNNKELKKIVEYSKIFDMVYVFDNTPKANTEFDIFTSNSKIIVNSNGINDGLACAYNYFLKETKEKYDFLCTLDQDSRFTKENIKSMFDFITNNDLTRIAVIGPKVIYNNSFLKSKKVNKIIERKYLISSGSFLNLSILDSSGIIFDVEYFIDRVDTDFCMNCIRNGYQIIEYLGSVLNQTLGSPKNHSNIGSHSYKRHYYMFRNRFYFNKKFIDNWPLRSTLNIMQTLRQCMRIIIFEDHKSKKIKQLFYALQDFHNEVMEKGRYNQ